MGRRSWALRVGLFAVLVAGVWWHDVPAAVACSCLISSDAESLERSDAVFTGAYVRAESVSDIGELIDQMPRGSFPGTRYVFAVDEVFKGEVAPDQSVVTEPGGGMCGMSEPEAGVTLLVFTTRASSGELRSSLCSGNRPVADAELPATFPAARGPSADAPAAVPAPSSDDPPGWWFAAGAGLLLVAGVVVWRVVVGRRRVADAADPGVP